MNQRERREIEVFNAALELTSPAERAAYLDQACQGKSALRHKVEALLSVHTAADAMFEKASRNAGGELAPTAPVDSRGTAFLASPAEAPGTVIDRYKVLQLIGEGGFGAVYMAEQKAPVKRRVALKILKLGMDTKQVVVRFEAERQALALMDHPNIAKVLDAGATGSGRPYFVMELVHGVSITQYCDENKLPPMARLTLFTQVCHAIQHAHQKGIIHRDIKPSNILVTLHDGVPVPKVIDFGIAKATQQELTEKTLFTQFQQFIGTPAYMSPEQAEMTGLDIDTRSDIYALGVLLYELLTGKTPFDAKTLLAAGMEEMRRILREQEPVRPSTRVSTMADAERTTVARHRQSEVPRLIHLLRGDLDWIVMKCLEKDRTRRYETANGLAQDIERHLTHQPVMARPASTAYRLRKFARRNKVIVTAGTAVAAALVLGAAVSTWQAWRATLAEREQGRQRIRAEANEQRALKAQANETVQRQAAEQAQRQAQSQELLARQNVYAADVRLADTLLRENNLGQALTALRRQVPKRGETDLRRIEWRYLWHKCQGQQLKTFPHEAEVTRAELSPDGRWLATASGGSFWVWDTTREGERRALSSGAPADAGFLSWGEHLAFDPQGRFLATATSSNVWIWTIPDWRTLRSLPATNASLCFSGDGTTLATFGEEGIQVWKTVSWERLVELRNQSKADGLPQFINVDCRSIALSRDGSMLAASWQAGWREKAAAEGEVALWQVPRRQILHRWTEVKDAIRVAFSEDDQLLAACSSGPPTTVWLWSVPDGNLLARWPASQGSGRALAFAGKGRVLATAGSDQVIRIWDTSRIDCHELLQGHVDEVCSLKFLADGRLVSASRDKRACLWSVETNPSKHRAFTLPPGRLICAPTADVRRMVAVNLAKLTFEEWDTTQSSSQPLRETSIQGADAILHRGTLMNGKPLTNGFIGTGTIVMDNLNVGPGVSRMWLLWHPPWARNWDLCATTGDGFVYAWKSQTGELIYSNRVAASALAAYPMVEHNQLVLMEPGREAPYMGGPLCSYDLLTRQTVLIDECKPHADGGVSPDGRLFAYGTTKTELKVWDAATKQTRFAVKLPERPCWIEFSPDSRLLAVVTSRGWVQVLGTATGKTVSESLAAYWAGTCRVSFSADAKSLVTYSTDHTAKIWDIATGREMVSGLPVNSFLMGSEWTALPPDGNSVVEGAGEGAIRVVDLPTLAQIDGVEERKRSQD